MKSSDSSNSSGGEGNTKTSPPQDSPKVRWSFTYHYKEKDEIEVLESILSSISSKFIFGLEMGKSGKTPHCQGYFELKKKQRFKAVKEQLFPSIHLEPSKKSRIVNVEYCTKECGRLYGNLAPEKIYCEEPSKELEFLVPLMKNYDTYKGDRLIHVIVDYKGGLGKTEFARWACLNLPDCIVTGGKSADMRNQVVGFKDSVGHYPKFIIMDIPRSCLNYVSYEGIELMKNMLFYSGKYEGGMVVGNKPFLLLLMNELPRREELSEDRWKIYEFGNEEVIDL
jgi:hypothetical protein